MAARDGFLTEDIPYETALVSLDLAQLYAEQGRTAELKRLSAELVPIFASDAFRTVTVRSAVSTSRTSS
jgi:hypothetical protein